jgi:predicted PurR-regulated permease PerM
VDPRWPSGRAALWRAQNPPAGSTLTAIVVGVVVVAALYFGREVLVPIALAVLLSFVLAPLVRLLQYGFVPRVLSVITVTIIALAVALGLAAIMVAQVNQLAGELPRYESTLRDKVQSFKGILAGTGTLERASEMLRGLRKEIEKSEASVSKPTSADPTPVRPIPVEVRQPDPGALQTLAAVLTPLIFPLTTTGVVFIFVIFILLQREDLRNRLVRLAGAHDLQRTTAALDDAGERLSRLFLNQLGLNAAFGLVIGAGLWIIGVPSAPLWGMLAMMLRFVPYVGAVIAAVFPILLAAAVDPGWSMVFWTAGLFLVLEPLVGHVIEPMLFGHSAGLSPVAVVIAATFWTWLWGPIGLVLATPLTICLVVLGRHVDRLKFLEIMLGDQPALKPAELIYQRMLAGDPVEASEQARLYLREKPLISYYDDILLDGLKLAQIDADRGRLDQESTSRIRDAVAEIVDDLSGHQDVETANDPNGETTDASPLAQLDKVETEDGVPPFSDKWRVGKPVLCVPGRGMLDETLAIVTAALVERLGIGARAERAEALSMDRIFNLEINGVEIVCLCYLETTSAGQVRYSVRRLRRLSPNLKVLVAMFRGGLEMDERPEHVEIVEGNFSTVLERVTATAKSQPEVALGRGPLDLVQHNITPQDAEIASAAR